METKTTQEEQKLVVREYVPYRRISVSPELGVRTITETHCEDEGIYEESKEPCPTCGR